MCVFFFVDTVKKLRRKKREKDFDLVVHASSFPNVTCV